MYILLWLVFGAFVGWVASILMGKNAKMGLVANIIVGLIGSAIGMFLLDLFTSIVVDSFTFQGFAVAVGGAMILIAIITAIQRR